MNNVRVIGAGLAGCEAAWQLAERGINVFLHEMKPEKRTPAHNSDDFAELVCSNSLRSDIIENAVGLLKEEMRRLGSLIMACADACRVAAGGALAVDREVFSKTVTGRITSHPSVTVVHGEVTEIPADMPVIVATGPLTSDKLADSIRKLVGADYLSFYDAAAPIVTAESIDLNHAFFASRYGRGGDDYLNCPMTREEYEAFHRELTGAGQAEIHGFEDENVFEGCMPVEVMARRGRDTLLFGPLKPVGLSDPRTNSMPYAVVQLRRDNAAGTLYNLVGFQTHLKFGEQKRVFSMIPALKNAEFARYGVMHRNTYINSPRLLNPDYSLIDNPDVYFAGQITGVEGYVESAASGLCAGLMLARRLSGLSPENFSDKTAIGALSAYVSNRSVTDFQPMNINFGIIARLEERFKGKRNKRIMIAERALREIENSGINSGR
ncbi:MAG: methylenetetrahydrofolate--tRNA-(uracil(54)-C(5))-methyltransferase (FADH(2)-oxidizing) TrmFO [Clostridiales bacterium]|jgi:methylenetetrahydrofolate--tRNA-(uracil-5-)-methyltransferase|nr:methylenetetrahydrofolate--tRNA-(uracil(54)-C(5))-methyltransferase (FADH(2)-oxidizing) TrmFO [Clostridiales bacterium]